MSDDAAADVSDEVVARIVELEELRQANRAALADLQSRGATLDPFSVLTKRLELLINFVMPESSPSRVVFELVYERAIAETLLSAAAEVRKALLTSAVQARSHNSFVTNKLVMPPGDVRG